MPNNIDRKKRETLTGTLINIALIVVLPCVILVLCALRTTSARIHWLLLAAALAELGMLIPILINLRKRFQEIEGGEEDEAAQY